MFIRLGKTENKIDFKGRKLNLIGTHHKCYRIWPFKIWFGYEMFSSKITKYDNIAPVRGKFLSYIEIKRW